jgi:tartrate-resistant acid phosphatase type 5
MKKLVLCSLVIFLVACVLSPKLPAAPTVKFTQVTEIPTQIQTVLATDALTLTPSIIPTLTESPAVTPSPQMVVRFAVIGDYGSGNRNEEDVANLIKSWSPDFIITTGDNNYPSGQASTIDHRIGQFFHGYIYPYSGVYGEGAAQNRFFPTLGNHDWMAPGAQPYLDYFTLPGNERYYDFIWGPVQFFAVDSDSNEPDSVSRKGVQANWLKEQLAASSAIWKIVYMHQPPYSSGLHGSIDWARWPYKSWGANAVLGGHDHDYERLLIDGLPYFVNGLGGGDIYYFKNVLEGSKKRYVGDYGAMLVEVNSQAITFQFITRKGEVIDTYTLEANK